MTTSQPTDLERLMADNKLLREALTFYSDPDNYKGGKVKKDRGRAARDALFATLGDDAVNHGNGGHRWTTIFSYTS